MSKLKKPPAKDAGAPQGLITSLLVGVPFLSVLVLQDSLSQTQIFLRSFAMAALLVQGLAICFYWRRISGSKWKNFLAACFLALKWSFMIGVTAAQVASLTLASDIDFVRTVVGAALVGSGFLGALFAIVWGMQGKGKLRYSTLALTALTVVLSVVAIQSENFLENMARPDGEVISAKEFDGDSSGSIEASGREELNPAEEKLEGKEWSYQGEAAAPYWADISKEYELCRHGGAQSPIDIAKGKKPDGRLIYEYKKTSLKVEDTGKRVELSFDKGSFVRLSEHRFSLKKMGFHSPSEHTIGGKHYPMELQLTHENEKGQMIHVGVMVKAGRAHKSVDKILASLDGKGREKGGKKGWQISATDFLPGSKDSYIYKGSQTTPPCLEGVLWSVLAEPISMSKKQIRRFQEIYHHNNRPIQKRDEKLGH